VFRLRAEFPYFSNPPQVDGVPVAYLDSVATSQRPIRVLDVERAFLERDNAAVHRGTSQAGGSATERFENARAAVATFVGAMPNEIVWAAGATDALNLIAFGISEANAADAGLAVDGSERFHLGPG